MGRLQCSGLYDSSDRFKLRLHGDVLGHEVLLLQTIKSPSKWLLLSIGGPV